MMITFLFLLLSLAIKVEFTEKKERKNSKCAKMGSDGLTLTIEFKDKHRRAAYSHKYIRAARSTAAEWAWATSEPWQMKWSRWGGQADADWSARCARSRSGDTTAERCIESGSRTFQSVAHERSWSEYRGGLVSKRARMSIRDRRATVRGSSNV